MNKTAVEFLSTPSARRATYGMPEMETHYCISIHALREEGDANSRKSKATPRNFYPRPPRGGRRLLWRLLSHWQAISIHALREEGDQQSGAEEHPIPVFLSTPSARRATPQRGRRCERKRDFYPRPPRGGRPMPALREIHRTHFYPRPPRGGRLQTQGVPYRRWLISIHALREEGDARHPSHFCTTANFYPRPPRGGRRRCWSSAFGGSDFYPRPPRGGRPSEEPYKRWWGNISIHALREEGDVAVVRVCLALEISIHALREEGDLAGMKFQDHIQISIHALREEGDSKNGEKHLRFCFIIKRSAQIWKSFSKNIRKNSCDLHRTA